MSGMSVGAGPALLVIESVADLAPALTGSKVTPIAQLAAGATPVQVLEATANDWKPGPMMSVSETVSGPSPSLVIVSTSGGEAGSATRRSPKASVAGEGESSGPTPVPVSATEWGEPGAFEITSSEAVSAPRTLGSKVMSTVHSAPGAMSAPSQSWAVIGKLIASVPEIWTPSTSSGAVPPLTIVTRCVALGSSSTDRVPKSSAPVLICTAAWVPVPVRSIRWGLPGASLVTSSVEVLAPGVVGANEICSWQVSSGSSGAPKLQPSPTPKWRGVAAREKPRGGHVERVVAGVGDGDELRLGQAAHLDTAEGDAPGGVGREVDPRGTERRGGADGERGEGGDDEQRTSKADGHGDAPAGTGVTTGIDARSLASHPARCVRARRSGP